MFLDVPPLKFTYQPVLEIRERLERRIDKDFNENARDNRTDLFGRYRFGISAKYGLWKGMLVMQYAEDPAWTPTGNSNTTERSDIILGYVSHPFAKGDVTLGRQRLRKGNERLLGESNWNNVSNAWDGLRWQSKKIDAFAAKLGVASAPSKEAKLGGLAYTSEYGETMYVFKHDDSGGNEVDIHTLDHLAKIRRGPMGLDVEAAGQVGHRNGKKVEAWAINSLLTYKQSAKLSFFATGNVASGGPANGDTYRTFDSLYATGHGIYGLSDLQGWRNTQNLGLGVRYKTRKDMELVGDYFNYGLRDARDGWYSNSGVNRRAGGRFLDATGKSGRDVGQELATELRWDARKDLTVHFGVGVFMPGHFIKSLVPAGSTNHEFGYLQLAYKF